MAQEPKYRPIGHSRHRGTSGAPGAASSSVGGPLRRAAGCKAAEQPFCKSLERRIHKLLWDEWNKMNMKMSVIRFT